MYPNDDDPLKKFLLVVMGLSCFLIVSSVAYEATMDQMLQIKDPEAWAKKHFYQELNRTTVIKLGEHEYVFSRSTSDVCIFLYCYNDEGKVKDGLIRLAKDFAYYNSFSIVNMTFLESGQLLVKYAPTASTPHPNEVKREVRK